MTVKYVDTLGRAIPVRKNTPQVIGAYTFLDENKAIIPLGSYVSCALQLRLTGALYATLAATISNPTIGQATLPGTYAFTTSGIWQAQFVCVDALGGKLYGEPLQFRVVDNEDDALAVDPALPY